MWELTGSQKALLKGLAELACRLYQLQHSDTFTPDDYNSEVRCKRAMSALRRDASEVRKHLTGTKGGTWDKLVKMALAIPSPIEREAFSRVLDVYSNPPTESVEPEQTSYLKGL